MAVWYDFKAAVDHSDLYGVPFSKFERKGLTSFENAQNVLGGPTELLSAENYPDEVLVLNDRDTPARGSANKSGAFTLKMAPGYTARFFILTQRGGYFDRNLKEDSDITETVLGLFGRDSGIFFTLSGDDYISGDVDAVQTDIGTFRLRLDGEFQNKEDAREPNNEVFVYMLWCASDNDLLPPDPTTPPTPRPDPAPPMPNPDPTPSPPPPEPDPEPEPEPDDDGTSQNRFFGILALGLVAVFIIYIFTKSDGGGGEGGGPPAE